MKRSLFLRAVILAVVGVALGAGAAPGSGAVHAADFASAAFVRTWTRVDQPVSAGSAARSWYWGPAPKCSVREAYVDAPDGSGGRLVQYFDKSRMEINNPSADPNSPWFVTNGLLAYELISGQIQIGNNSYVASTPADIPLASDMDDAAAPTYRSFVSVTSTPFGTHLAASALGQPATATIDRNGTVGNDPSKASLPGTVVTYYDQTTQHNVPRIFWDFINASGLVNVGGQLVIGKLSDPPLFVTGLPISEAYWARVRIGGRPTDVLIQAFQRRVLTYVPVAAPPWNVQMGNIGAHYLLWRYGNYPCATPPPPPLATATPTVTPVPPTPAAAAVPLYRLRNRLSNEHFYTIDAAERSTLLRNGYDDEGSEGRVWNMPLGGTVPFYRLWNNQQGAASRHLYTIAAGERDAQVRNGWVEEFGPDGGPGGGYVFAREVPQTVPLFRWYNQATNDHIYTISNISLLRQGYRSEGQACFVIRP